MQGTSGASEGDALPANRVGRELRLLEAAVEMDHHRVVDVLRILPARHWVRDDGTLDAGAAMRLALKRFDILWRVSTGDARARIEPLEADANSFWVPTDGELDALGTARLKRRPGPRAGRRFRGY